MTKTPKRQRGIFFKLKSKNMCQTAPYVVACACCPKLVASHALTCASWPKLVPQRQAPNKHKPCQNKCYRTKVNKAKISKIMMHVNEQLSHIITKKNTVVPLPFQHKLKYFLILLNFTKIFITCAEILIKLKFRLSNLN